MSDITLSKAVRTNLLNLQNTATLMGKTQERLSSGLRVNSALDNPTNFFTAAALNSRASDLGLLMDSVSNAVQTIAAADKGIKAITKLVESAQSTARQALQSPATIEQTNTILGNVLQEAGRTGTVDVNGTPAVAAGGTGATLDGSDDAGDHFSAGQALSVTINGETYTFELFNTGGTDPSAGNVVGVEIDFANDSVDDVLAAIEGAIQAADFDGVTPGTFSLAIDSGAVAFSLGSTDDESVTFGGALATTLGIGGAHDPEPATDPIAAAVAGGQTLTVRVGTGEVQTITFGNDPGQVNDLTTLQAALAGLDGVDAEIDGDGQIVITGQDGASVTFGGSALSTFGLGTAGTVNATREPSTTETQIVANPKRNELIAQYNELLIQIDQLARDSSYNGVNLLIGDGLEVIFNEDGTSKLVIDGDTDTTSQGLGLTGLLDGAWESNDAINDTLATLKGAIENLRTQASKFGSNLSVVETRQNFTKEMINVLETGAANLTLADINEEAANLLALQTRQQLSSTALSMAAQADQQVLQLF